MPSTPSALDYVLGAAATARLTRLVTSDSILDRPRRRYLRVMDQSGHPKMAELAMCPWCSSIWIGGAVAAVAHARVPGYRLAASALAFSLAAGLADGLYRGIVTSAVEHPE